MKKSATAYFLFCVFLSSSLIKAQPGSPETIRFAKDPSLVYFFQKGRAGDSILKNKSDLFYLLVPDTLKPHISILTENGRLLSTGNDSLVRFDFLKGLNYESVYFAEETGIPRRGQPANKKWVFKSAINGALPAGPSDKVLIRVVDRREEKVLIENVFYYVP